MRGKKDQAGEDFFSGVMLRACFKLTFVGSLCRNVLLLAQVDKVSSTKAADKGVKTAFLGKALLGTGLLASVSGKRASLLIYFSPNTSHFLI